MELEHVNEPHAELSPADKHSMASLLPLVYAELKALAINQLQHRPGHTLQPTALVHEAYLKMSASTRGWKDREHFLATAATAMRHVLIDHLRRKNAEKRGGGNGRSDISLEQVPDAASGSLRDCRVLELDVLLTELAAEDPRAAAAAEMRLFGGMDQVSIARVQGVSRTIVASDWQFARAWLAARMSESGPDPSSGGDAESGGRDAQ